MKKYISLIFLSFFTLTTFVAHAGSSLENYTTDDWSVAADKAREENLPIMIVFSADDCGYCEHLKEEILNPGVLSGTLSKKVLVREFNIDVGGKITDFDGERIRARIFVSRYKVFATPTVVFVDANGETITPPIVGYNNPEQYQERLDEALDSAYLNMAVVAGRVLAQLDLR
ncbi:MAG: thioredoxin fold domain-containing protein [Candidatus Sedimenticola sp. PURPLELP]